MRDWRVNIEHIFGVVFNMLIDFGIVFVEFLMSVQSEYKNIYMFDVKMNWACENDVHYGQFDGFIKMNDSAF